MAADPHRAKDLLLRDSLGAQKKNGVIPDTRGADRYWSETLERVAQKRAASRSSPKPSPQHGPSEDPGDTRDAAQIIKDEGAELLREGDSRLEQVFRRRQRRAHSRQELLQLARWRLLLHHPEWRERAIAVYSLQSAYTPESAGGGYRAYAAAAHRLLADSDRVFGDWRKQKLPGDPL